MEIKEKVKTLPSRPGVYLLKDAEGRVIYVGKAASLKKRVSSYFQPPGESSPKLRILREKVKEIDYIVTDSEVEALILECNLIKEYRPTYNIRLKDDKKYPFIKVTRQEEFPRLYLTRTVVEDGSRYYGPYTDVKAARKTLRLLRKVFLIRSCRRESSHLSTAPPCLNYYIERCSGPCTGKVSPEEYQRAINSAGLFLEGKMEKLLKDLRKRMKEASQNLHFEQAASLRDQILALEKMGEKQKITLTGKIDRDFISWAKLGRNVCIAIFMVREGKVIGENHFFLKGTQHSPPSEFLRDFLKQYYIRASFLPREIILPHQVEEAEFLEKWLSEKKGSSLRIVIPQRGDKKRLLALVERNALLKLSELKGEEEEIPLSLIQLQKLLSLPNPPQIIEAFDISNIRGKEAVGAMVRFINGKPSPQEWRKFKVREVKGIDDYAMIGEVIYRRYNRLIQEGKTLPDLILVDGGKGQVAVSREKLRKLGIEEVQVIGLAKEFEHIFFPHTPEPIIIPPGSPALHLLQHIRDEAHRFAHSYHLKLRKKGELISLLDEIPGIGEKTKRILIQHFGTLKRLKESSVEEITRVKGIGRTKAQIILNYLKRYYTQGTSR